MIGLGGFEKILIVVIMAMREATVSSVMDIAVAWIDSFEAETIGIRESMMNGWFLEIKVHPTYQFLRYHQRSGDRTVIHQGLFQHEGD